jgi:hypothetical protein
MGVAYSLRKMKSLVFENTAGKKAESKQVEPQFKGKYSNICHWLDSHVSVVFVLCCENLTK